MWIVRAALQNPYAVSVAALLFLVIGSVSVLQVPVDILPAFKSPGVLVLTFYNGMPASAIDRNITTRMERWCGQATGVVKVEAKSMVGVSIVRLLFRDDIDPAAALTEVNSLALSTLKTLPPGTLPPIVRPFDPTATLPLCILSVSSPDGRLGESALQDLARVDLRNQLGGLPGVIAPVAFGGRERAVMVYVRPGDMEARQISPLDVVRSLRDYNQMLAAGTAKFGDEEVQLESNALVVNVDDYNEVPIKILGDKQVYLRDVAQARDASRVQTALVRINGRPQVYVPVYRQQGASSLAVVDAVKDELPLMKARAPDGVELDVVMDQSVYVRHAIESLVHEGVLGALLAAGMILIFLGDFRSTIIATLTIPLAVLAAIAALLATGNTINAMTLGGLALAVGPLVDNAIVVLENTHRHLGMGKATAQAAADGTGEVAQPALVATLSTILVLVPLALMPGMGKFLFRPLGLAVAFAMIASLFLALTFVPARCAGWLRSHRGHAADNGRPAGPFRRFHARVERFLHGLTRRYERLLRLALRNRALVLGGVGLLLVLSLGLLPWIGREFFPQIDSGQLTLFFRCPTGTKIEKTNERLDRFEAFLREVIPPADLRMIVSEVGVTTNWSAAYTPNSGPQDAVIKVQLTEDRSRTAQEYASLLRRRFEDRQRTDPDFADLRLSFDTGGMVTAALNYGATSPIEIQVVGGPLEQANAKAREIRDRVKGIPGTADVRILQRFDYPQMVIEIDRKKAQLLGLDVPEVCQTVTTALNSSVVVDRNFWLDPRNGNQYWIGVQYEEDKLHTNLEAVKNISLRSKSTGEVVKLGTIVNFRRRDAAPAELTHDNLANVVSVMVNTDGRDIGGVSADIQAKLQGLELPRGMVLRISGEYERMNESFRNLGFGLVLAAVLVYLLMVAQFRSYLSPFIIMFAVPLGLIGVLFTLFLTRTTLNVQSSMGVIFMVGIVVANATLLVDFANKRRELGASVYEAITSAAAIRLRPILMTFLATFLDLLPMAIGLGKGSEANVPLARAVVGGLLASTVLTLFVVPVLYTLFNRDRMGEPGPEEEEVAPVEGQLVTVG
jgi:multidrug efflux pump subunit AcrB